jgi:hypothetical protein
MDYTQMEVCLESRRNWEPISKRKNRSQETTKKQKMINQTP